MWLNQNFHVHTHVILTEQKGTQALFFKIQILTRCARDHPAECF